MKLTQATVKPTEHFSSIFTFLSASTLFFFMRDTVLIFVTGNAAQTTFKLCMGGGASVLLPLDRRGTYFSNKIILKIYHRNVARFLNTCFIGWQFENKPR